MPLFTIKMTERVTLRASGEFHLDAATAAIAAKMISDAYDMALVAGNGLMTLPNGQQLQLDQGEVETRQLSFQVMTPDGPIDIPPEPKDHATLQ